jgi:hypothetical protein
MNKTESIGLMGTFIPSTALAYIHRFVQMDGTYAGANEYSIGVLKAVGVANVPAPFAINGIMFIEAGGEIDVGESIVCGSNGKAAAATLYQESGGELTSPANIQGIALDAATQDGDVIRMLVK